jgi:alpha-ribazole phosphatase
MTQLYLTRHGETDWNIKQRFQGHSDIPLNENGRCQAADLARRLAEESIDAIYASNLSRAWETAETIAEHHSCPLIAEPGLREASFGKWEGMTYNEIQASDPEAVQAWHEDMANFAPPEGETPDQLAQRVASAYATINQQHGNDETVLLVAHGGSLQMLIANLLQLSPAHFWQFHLKPCSLSLISVYEEGPILNLLNDTCHLKTK